MCLNSTGGNWSHTSFHIVAFCAKDGAEKSFSLDSMQTRKFIKFIYIYLRTITLGYTEDISLQLQDDPDLDSFQHDMYSLQRTDYPVNRLLRMVYPLTLDSRGASFVCTVSSFSTIAAKHERSTDN